MKTVNIGEAKAHFSELIAAVERGEEVVIARRGKPIARISGCGDTVRPSARRLGFAAGLVEEVDPNWHEPMTDAEIREVFGDAYADEIGARGSFWTRMRSYG